MAARRDRRVRSLPCETSESPGDRPRVRRRYAESLCLCFRLLLARILRPAFVLMRALKPCTFFLFLLFGWYVRFILPS
jgi:hypothetical protein